MCQFLGVNPTILAGLLSHVAVDAIADAFISMIKHILNASDANIAAVQWIADQFIPAILMAIRYHKGPHVFDTFIHLCAPYSERGVCMHYVSHSFKSYVCFI